MGTDIHLYVEQKLPDGRWAPLSPPDEFLLFGESREQIAEYAKDWHDPTVVYMWQMHRCYNLFAILADVRNGVGFAGTDTGDGFIPIADPRDLPEDLSPELQAMQVDHTPSWLLWEEIAEYPHWRAGVTKHRAWVDAYNYKDWVVRLKRTGEPVNYCGGAHGPGVRLVDQAELDRQLETIPDLAIEKLRQPFADHKTIFDKIYTIVQWPVTYREAVGPEWWRFFEIVQGYNLDPRHLRLVFYFDS